MDASIRLPIEAQDNASQVVDRMYAQVGRGRRSAASPSRASCDFRLTQQTADNGSRSFNQTGRQVRLLVSELASETSAPQDPSRQRKRTCASGGDS